MKRSLKTAARFALGVSLVGLMAAPVSAATGTASLFDPLAAQAAYAEAYARIDPSPEYPKQSKYLNELVEKKGGSAVPVLMPYSMTSSEENARYHRLGLRVQKTNYTGIVHQPGLEIVINGSRDLGSPLLQAVATTQSGNYNHGFSAFEDERGGRLSFGWGGTNYNVEFHCHGMDEPGHGNCINAEKAESFVRNMLAGK